jgi:hypothetical protein
LVAHELFEIRALGMIRPRGRGTRATLFTFVQSIFLTP